MTTIHTLRTHKITWALGDRTGTFEVDTTRQDDWEAIVRNYLDEYVGTDAVITAVERVA